MAARLASFRGPSTPSSSPVKQAQSPNNKSTQAAKPTESTYHRKVRASLQELQAACHTWDDLVRKDGLRAARELIDARTDLECVVSLFLAPCYPRGFMWECDAAICLHSCLTESSRALASSVQSSHIWTSASRRLTWSYRNSCALLSLSLSM
jgi:hypothetical protein